MAVTQLCRQCKKAFSPSALNAGLCLNCFGRYTQMFANFGGGNTGKWSSGSGNTINMYNTSDFSEGMLDFTDRTIEEWKKDLEKFPDLTIEYPEDFFQRKDHEIYLEAIHKLKDEHIYSFLTHIYEEMLGDKQYQGIYRNMFKYAGISRSNNGRALTVLDAFVIREYIHRRLLTLKKIAEKEAAREKLLAQAKSEDWYKNWPDNLKYRLETCLEHRIAQRTAEEHGNENVAKQCFEYFKQALAYEESLKKEAFMADEIYSYGAKRNLDIFLDFETIASIASRVGIAIETPAPQPDWVPNAKQAKEISRITNMLQLRQISRSEYDRRYNMIKNSK